MQISATLPLNSGIYEFDERRRKALDHFHQAVHLAKFLDEEEKRRWRQLGYFLDMQGLDHAKRLIIAEDLHRLKMEHQLERLKSQEK